MVLEDDPDDGYPWFGCVCGICHNSFWLQCDSCNAWHNVSPRCIGKDEMEKGKEGKWKCPGCCLDEQRVQAKSKEDINKENQLLIGRNKHFIYSDDLTLLDNEELLGPEYVLTERSTAICSRLITYFLLNENSKSEFKFDLWIYIWHCLRYEQKLEGWELGWNCHLSEYTKGTKYYYVPKASPHSYGLTEGINFFSSPEGVVAFICDIILKSGRNESGHIKNTDDIKSFRSKLSDADKLNNTYEAMKGNSQLSVSKRKPQSILSSSDQKKRRLQLKPDESEIIKLTQELLNAIAADNTGRVASLCSSDCISFQQSFGFQTQKTDLIRGCNTSKNGAQQNHNKIFASNCSVEWQGEHNDIAVISYTRHDIISKFEESTRKEVRMWSKKGSTWLNTFTCTLPLSSLKI